MAEDKKEFVRRLKAFHEAGAAGDWDKAIALGEALRAKFPDSFDTNETNTENLASAYNNHGNSYADLEQYERAIEDYSKAIELKPDYVNAHHNRALAIGRQEAEKATQTIKESYEKRLKSITNPAEIDRRFEARKKISEERLNRYRQYTGWCIGVLVFLIPTVWFDLFNETEIFNVNCKENDCSNFFLIAKNISVTVTTLFLLSPLFLALSYCTRNARIERQTLEDYDRKSIMLLIRNQEGAHIQTLIEHFDKRGTPEMLNKLYHPKHAYPKIASRIASLGVLKKCLKSSLRNQNNYQKNVSM